MRAMNPANTEVAHTLSAAGAAALPVLLGVPDAPAAAEGWWVICACAAVLGAVGRAACEAAAPEQLRIAEVSH
jgi:hypothetical protein